MKKELEKYKFYILNKSKELFPERRERGRGREGERERDLSLCKATKQTDARKAKRSEQVPH
jgi:hypothetical protein